MDTKRQNKISRLIQKDISDIFQTDYQNFFGPVLITITKVRVTSDLSLARINLSIFGTDDKIPILNNIKNRFLNPVRGRTHPFVCWGDKLPSS